MNLHGWAFFKDGLEILCRIRKFLFCGPVQEHWLLLTPKVAEVLGDRG